MNKTDQLNFERFLVVSIVLVFSVLTIVHFNNQKDIEVDGIVIDYESYKGATEIFKDNLWFAVCNIKDKNCASFVNLDHFQELKSEMQSD